MGMVQGIWISKKLLEDLVSIFGISSIFIGGWYSLRMKVMDFLFIREECLFFSCFELGVKGLGRGIGDDVVT